MVNWYVEPTLTCSKYSLHMLSILQHVLAHHMCQSKGGLHGCCKAVSGPFDSVITTMKTP